MQIFIIRHLWNYFHVIKAFTICTILFLLDRSYWFSILFIGCYIRIFCRKVSFIIKCPGVAWQIITILILFFFIAKRYYLFQRAHWLSICYRTGSINHFAILFFLYGLRFVKLLLDSIDDQRIGFLRKIVLFDKIVNKRMNIVSLSNN